MAFNGAGTFQLVAGNPVVTGTIISSTVQNNTMNDIANNGLTNCITKDGQTTPTANIPLGGFRLTNVANAVNAQDAVTAAQIQSGGLLALLGVSGTDTITASTSPAIAAYAAGQRFQFIAAGANTTNAVTLNINALGAKNVTKYGSNALSKGDIPSGAEVVVIYDGTQFQIVSVIVSRGVYGIRNLSGGNTAGSTTTKMTFAADAVTLRNPTTGEVITLVNTGNITCDTGLAGPAANGRDQAGVFSASTWLHWYFIWNGSILSTVVSTVAPPTGPTLPAGYTHWAYIGAVFFNGSSQLVQVAARGSWFAYLTEVGIAATGSTTETSISVASAAPPNALNISLNFQCTSTTDSNGNWQTNVVFRLATGVNFAVFSNKVAVNNATAGTQSPVFSGALIMPLLNGSSILYISSNVIGPSNSNAINLCGYQVPNGGE